MPPTRSDEVFRYRKDARIRAYYLQALSEDRAELWVVTANGGTQKCRKLATFDDPTVISPFLEDIERELRLGGWSKA